MCELPPGHFGPRGPNLHYRNGVPAGQEKRLSPDGRNSLPCLYFVCYDLRICEIRVSCRWQFLQSRCRRSRGGFSAVARSHDRTRSRSNIEYSQPPSTLSSVSTSTTFPPTG